MIGIAGGGNVGANTAFFLAEHHTGPVLVYDTEDKLSTGKTLDMMEASPIRGYKTWIRGVDDQDELLECDTIILAAGSVRTPGMKREELFEANKSIILEYARLIQGRDKKVLIMTEPVDMCTTLFAKASSLPPNQIMGLGTVLDAARLQYILSRKTGVSIENISCQVIGRHSDELIVPSELCSISGINVYEFLNPDEFTELVDEARSAGDLIVHMAKRGSAYYGPSSVAAEVAGAVSRDLHRIFPISHILSGQYGITGAALSLPAVVDSGGVSVTLTPHLKDSEIDTLRRGGEYIKKIVEGVLE